MKLLEVIQSTDNLTYTLFTENQKYELDFSQVQELLTEEQVKELETNKRVIVEMTLTHWMSKAAVMPIIKRTAAVRKAKAGKEAKLSKFIGISGRADSPIINFSTQATFTPNKYRTRIQLVDLKKWRTGKELYTMSAKEFREILDVCDVRFDCTCMAWHWIGMKYDATELDSAIVKTNIPHPVWGKRKGFASPSLCKHLRNLLPLIKPNSGKFLRVLKDRFSTRMRSLKKK